MRRPERRLTPDSTESMETKSVPACTVGIVVMREQLRTLVTSGRQSWVTGRDSVRVACVRGPCGTTYHLGVQVTDHASRISDAERTWVLLQEFPDPGSFMHH